MGSVDAKAREARRGAGRFLVIPCAWGSGFDGIVQRLPVVGMTRSAVSVGLGESGLGFRRKLLFSVVLA
jgi:hypothetical protein